MNCGWRNADYGLKGLFSSPFQPEGEENCLPFTLMALIPQFHIYLGKPERKYCRI
jgi:hypothetical protein